MSPKILSGIEAREHMMIRLIKRFEAFSAVPELAIIQVGNRSDSAAYIRAKITFAHKVGATARHIHLPETVSEDEIIDRVRMCNADRAIKGIIVQLPLPENLDRNKIIEAMDPKKDVDGLTPTNVALLEKNDLRAIVPATARGVLELLEYYDVSIKNKKVTVVGRSALVGRPIAQILEHEGAIVTVAHSKTVDLKKETREADIIIVAVGKIGLITTDHVRAGQTIIDVGINDAVGHKLEEEAGRAKLVGDVDFEKVKAAIGPSGAISPVPGGVGPMTVLGLFENLADAASNANGGV
jgi:methylenetetrahydrofolate dehydrogenase (NADP+)/methenyltetrahydrofolate cyclohydrolase